MPVHFTPGLDGDVDIQSRVCAIIARNILAREVDDGAIVLERAGISHGGGREIRVDKRRPARIRDAIDNDVLQEPVARDGCGEESGGGEGEEGLHPGQECVWMGVRENCGWFEWGGGEYMYPK